MDPSPKSPMLNEMLEQMSMDLYGRSRMQSIQENTCVRCTAPVDATHFSEEKYLAEYKLSGLCESCQAKVFAFAMEVSDERTCSDHQDHELG